MFAHLLAAAVLVADGSGAKIKLAAPGFNVVKIPEKEGAFYTDHFAQQMTLDGIRVITADEVRTLLGLEKQRQLAGCAESGCMVELANALGVDGVLTGSIGRFGDAYQINLKILSATDGALLSVYSSKVDSDAALLDELTAAADFMAEKVRAKLQRRREDAEAARAAEQERAEDAKRAQEERDHARKQDVERQPARKQELASAAGTDEKPRSAPTDAAPSPVTAPSAAPTSAKPAQPKPEPAPTFDITFGPVGLLDGLMGLGVYGAELELAVAPSVSLWAAPEYISINLSSGTASLSMQYLDVGAGARYFFVGRAPEGFFGGVGAHFLNGTSVDVNGNTSSGTSVGVGAEAGYTALLGGHFVLSVGLNGGALFGEFLTGGFGGARLSIGWAF